MEYLLVMSFSGSVMVGIYMLLHWFLKDKMSARLQYLLAKAAVLYYLLPLPFLKKWYGKLAASLMPERTMGVIRIFIKWENYIIRANGKLYFNKYLKMQIVILSVWVFIAFLLLILKFIDYLRTKQKIHDGINMIGTENEDSYERLKKQYKVRKKIVIFQGDMVEQTMTFGLFKPVVLCNRARGSLEAELLLCHEFIHIKRLDTLWKILSQLVIFLHWWNPVAWALYFDLERVCEWSCDETVIQGREKEEVKEYLRLLIEESTEGKHNRKIPLQWGLGFQNSAEKLQKRMENIMKKKKWNKVMAGIVLIALVFANSLTVFAYRDVNYATEEGSVSQQKIEKDLDMDEFVFIPDGTDDANLVFHDNSVNMDIRYEKQFVDGNGNVYPIEDEIAVEAYASCTHNYVSGTVQLHKKNENGGCVLETYSATRCSKCGNTIVGSIMSEYEYTACPH